MRVILPSLPDAFVQPAIACGAAAATCAAAQQTGVLRPSVGYLYARGRQLIGSFPAETGLSAQHAMRTAQLHGLCSAATWDTRDRTALPPPAADVDAALHRIVGIEQMPGGFGARPYTSQIKAQIDKGRPVVFGFGPDAQIAGLPADHIIRAPLGANLGSAHYLCCVGYDDAVGNGGAIYVQDSYGPGKGQNGRYWIEYACLVAFRTNDVWSCWGSAAPVVVVPPVVVPPPLTGNAMNVPALKSATNALVLGQITQTMIDNVRALAAALVVDVVPPVIVPPVVPAPVALATASQSAASYPPSAAINGDRAGRGVWWSSRPAALPVWWEVAFNPPRTISKVVVYSMQDAYQNPIEPTDALKGSAYCLSDFRVEINGTALAVVTANDRIKREVTLPAPIAAERVRIVVTKAGTDGYARIAEVEVG